jgi:hypothetical protein
MNTTLYFICHYTAEYNFLKNYLVISKLGTNTDTATVGLTIKLNTCKRTTPLTCLQEKNLLYAIKLRLQHRTFSGCHFSISQCKNLKF